MSDNMAKLEEKYKKLNDQKIKLLEKQAALKKRISEAGRKARTRELIQAGAIVEKYIGTRDIFEIEALCQIIVNNQNFEEIRQMVAHKAKELKKVQEKKEATEKAATSK